MFMSIFSSFDAVCAESLGQKVAFFSNPMKAVDFSPAARDPAPAAPESRIGEEKSKTGNSKPPADQPRQRQSKVIRRPRFAPELDGVHCFESIVPY